MYSGVREAICWVVWLLTCIALACGIWYGLWKLDMHLSPCTRVYDGQVIIFEGKAAQYSVKSAGAATLFRQRENRAFVPRLEKEFISSDIRAEPITCK